MAESQKTGLSSDTKQKNSLLDEEMGKEFLSSWKSMSVTEDDTMDFSFQTEANGKTKAFNLSKMDMDFTLGGDFDKISSFKVDLSDIDFSSKKTGKSKERSGEDSVKGKQDDFSFSFDFNDLDTFDFEPSFTKAEKKSSKGVSADKSVYQDTTNILAEDISAFDDGIAMKLPLDESATTLKAGTLVGGLGNLESTNEGGPSTTVAFENQSVSEDATISLGKKLIISTKETGEQSHPSEKTISEDTYDHQRIQDILVQSVSGSVSTQDTVLELQTEKFSQDPKVNNTSGGEQNSNAKSIAESGSNHENSLFDNSPRTAPSSNNDENKTSWSDHVQTENMVGATPAGTNLDLEETISRKTLHEATSENKNSTSELICSPLSSGPMVDKLIPMKGKDIAIIRSKYFKRIEESSNLQDASTQTKILSFGRKRIDDVHLSPADEKREESDANDAQTGDMLIANSLSHASELTKNEPVFLGSEKNIKYADTMKDDFNAERCQSRTKLVSTSRSSDQEATKDNTGLLERSVKDFNSFSLQVDPPSLIKPITKSSAQKCVKPKLMISSMAPIQSSKTTFVEGRKLSQLRTPKRIPGPSSLRASRPTGVSNILSTSTFGKEIESLRKSEQSMELQGNASSKMLHSFDTRKNTPPIPSLKRKTFEASNANVATLSPLKRLSESHSESRKIQEASERILEEQKLVDINSKNVLHDHPPFVLDIPVEVNMVELEIPLVMENDRNVEKAEAYTKDLEDICNMLKKKHEEAKEILVRAIVNNNNLLMLNHPIYEHKIRTLQKFAARITSKELHA